MKYIGFLGPQGTYSHHAANLYSTNSVKIPFNTINEVLNSLDTKESQEVVVPLENSIHGSIVEVLDFLAGDNKFNIIEELEVNINHSIFTLKTFRQSTIDVIFSHPQALGQCYEYLNEKYQNSELKISNSTADSLNDLIKSGISGAFIGPPWMKDNDGVVEIDKNIQSVDNNVTRFVVIGQGIRKKSKQDKTSVVFSFDVGDWGQDSWSQKNLEFQISHISYEQGMALRKKGSKLGVDVYFWYIDSKYDSNNLCPWPFERAYISSDMKIVPCCMIANPEVVNLGDAENFTKEWNAEKYKLFRENHILGKTPKICKNCYVNK